MFGCIVWLVVLVLKGVKLISLPSNNLIYSSNLQPVNSPNLTIAGIFQSSNENMLLNAYGVVDIIALECQLRSYQSG